MVAPGIHRAADYCMFDAAIPQVRGNGQAKRACANDKYVTDSHQVVPSRNMRAQLSQGNFPPTVRGLAGHYQGIAGNNQKHSRDRKLSKWKLPLLSIPSRPLGWCRLPGRTRRLRPEPISLTSRAPGII